MKIAIKTSVYLLGFIVLMLLTPSCSNDDDNSTVHELVGTWRRTDFSEDLEERYTFHNDKTGKYFFKEGSDTTTILFNWQAQENVLTFTHSNNELVVNYEINSLGQLVFSGSDELTYNKIP